MKSETMYLTDLRMTDLIYSSVKGDSHHKSKIKDDWLAFSDKTFHDDIHIDQFLSETNKWLTHHRIPIKVINFNRFADEDDPESVEWEIELTTHD